MCLLDKAGEIRYNSSTLTEGIVFSRGIFYKSGIEGMEKKKNIHSGHRARMRERFLTQGADSLLTHEMLEMLLYYAIPQKNTNPLAHELLNTFGSLRAVFTASPEALRNVPGTTSGVITMLAFLRAFYQRSMLESAIGANLQTKEDAVRIFRSITRFEESEQLWIAFLSKDLRVRDIVLFSDHAEKCVSVDVTKISEIAEKRSASTIIMMHNHLSGPPVPSSHDIEMTRRAVHHLNSDAVYLLDHLIITENTFCSMRAFGFFSEM